MQYPHRRMARRHRGIQRDQNRNDHKRQSQRHAVRSPSPPLLFLEHTKTIRSSFASSLASIMPNTQRAALVAISELSTSLLAPCSISLCKYNLASRLGMVLIAAVGVSLRIIGERRLEQCRTTDDAQDETVGSVGRAVSIPRLENVEVERHLQRCMRGQVARREV